MRAVVLTLFAALVLGSPAQAQSPEEIAELIAELKSEDPGVRFRAARALAQAGTEAVPSLTVALSDERQVVRMAAAFAFGDMGAEALPALPALIAALDHENLHFRNAIAKALGSIGPKAAGAVPNLIAALSHENATVRYTAAHALGRIRSNPALTIPALTAALSDSDTNVLGNAGLSLRQLGANTKELWWVVPRFYAKQLAGLVILLALWYVGISRFPRPKATSKHIALIALSAAAPVALACTAVGYAITRNWAARFLPESLTLVPFPVAAVLSTALVCVLPAVWLRQRKPIAKPQDV